MNTGLAIAILLGGFLLLVFLRFPIAYAVAIASIGCMLANGTNLALLCKMMVKGISSFSLMAVPFFITMGCLMGSGGISEKLIDLANSLVGWMAGGMAMVNIVASYFFGGISGSRDTTETSPQRSRLHPPARACWCLRAITWSFTPPQRAVFPSVPSSWRAIFPAHCWRLP